MNFITRSLCIRSNLNLNLNHKIIKTIILPKSLYIFKRYTSALYVPGKKANEELSFLKPDLNFVNHIDIEKFQNELNLRGCKFDLKKLLEEWQSYKILCAHKDAITEKHKEITNKIKTINLASETSTKEEEKDALICKSMLLKKDLKSIKESLWDFEENIIPQILKLPNEIDQRTPLENPIILKSISQQPKILEDEKQNHLIVGKNLGLLEFKSPMQYFLSNEAALFEYAILSLSGKILNNNGFIRMSGPNFCRSILIEGSGMDHENSSTTFIMENQNKEKKGYEINRLHLPGSASLPVLLAMYTKKFINENDFPVKIFNTGRQYTPISNESTNNGLFSVCQASVAQTLIFVKENDNTLYENELQNLIEITSKIYDNIGCHYQVVIKPVKKLDSSESMRISFEMWSMYLKEYIEVGYISVCGNYFSKRLLIGYQKSKKIKYPLAITGTLISVPKILACLFEENPNKFILPDQIKTFF